MKKRIFLAVLLKKFAYYAGGLISKLHQKNRPLFPLKGLSVLLFATVVALGASAGVNFKASHAVKNKKIINKEMVKFNAKQAKAESTSLRVITDQPEGELKSYNRAGNAVYQNDNGLYAGEQSGSMDIVYADGGKVYMKNILYNCGGYFGDSWVEGTIEGNEIHVPLGQSIHWSDYYQADVILAMGTTVVEGTSIYFTVDDRATEAIYVIDGETISLQGTYAQPSGSDYPAYEAYGLGCYWTDDDAFGGFNEWNTVLTELEPIVPPNVITTQPEGELHTYWRSSHCIYYSWYGIGKTPIDTIMDVVYGENSRVYIHNPLWWWDRNNSWVEGTYNPTTGIISVPVGQYLSWNDGYNYGVQLMWGNTSVYEDGVNDDGTPAYYFTHGIDESATEIQYKVDGDRIRLIGSKGNPNAEFPNDYIATGLLGVYSDDGSFICIEYDADLFPDCPEGEVRDAALYLYNLGIVEGVNGMLMPDSVAKRAHVAKMSLYGAYNGVANVPAVLPSDNFPSVYYDLQDTSTYYYRPARALLYLEYGDGVTPFDRDRLAFEPDSTISRVNVLKVLLEAFNFKPDLSSNSNPFPGDADVTALATKNPVKMGYIRRAVELGIITTANAKFRPHDKCTRGEIILMLARLMQKNNWQMPKTSDYFEPLNTTLQTISLGLGLPMGNFSHYTKTSFSLDGTIPLVFAHAYNSYNTTLPEAFFGPKTVDGVEDTYQPLGDGWSHNYHSYITLVGHTADGTARAVVHWGGGQIDIYKSDGPVMKPESLGVYDDFTIDNDGVVIKSKDQMEYRFKSMGGPVIYLTSIKDRNGNTLTLNYESGENGFKRIKSVTDGHRSLNFQYTLSGTNLLTKVSDPIGRSIQFSYQPNPATGHYRLSSFTDAKGQTTNYIYGNDAMASTSKLLTRIQLPKGNYIENEYEESNRRLKRTESGVNGVPTTQTSVSVAATYGTGTATTQSTVNVNRAGTEPSSYHYTYNGNNVVTSMTGEQGLFVNSTYGNDAQPQLPTAIQNNSSNVSNVTYDAMGNVTSITLTGNGTLTTTMTYDAMNNLTSVTDPKGYTTSYTYDANGNLIGVSQPEGVTTSISRDYRGLATSVTNAMGVRTNMEYNTYGNLTKTTLPALNLTNTAAYDGASRVTSVTDALGRTTSYSYDKNDNLLSETDAANHTTGYQYDQNDNLTKITNAKGGVTTMTYDNATDWLTSVAFAGSTKHYSYNDDGTLSAYTKPDGTTLSYSYDNLGRITSDGMYSYSYDNKLRLSSIAGGGKTLSFSYDAFNRITGTSCSGNSNSYSYDKNGNCLSVNGTSYGYDKLNRLTSVSFNNKTITYTYRKDSQLSKVTYPNGMTTTFTYDAVERPTGKTTKLGNGTIIASYTVTLDKHGNILSQTTKEPYGDMMLSSEDISYTYNSGNRITKAGSTSFTFDANGNTTKRGSEVFNWDTKDRLTKAGSTAITYDPLGLIASYGTTTFTTDPLGMGNVLSDSKSGATYIYGNGLEARVINGAASYYVTDMRGSVVAIVNESGTVTHKYQYDEFGKVVQKQEANYNPFQYVGKYGVMYLSDHLYYMRARHYDPTIGRFLSEDPIWSTNLYPYADNNPIMGIDPNGEYLEYKSGGITGRVIDGSIYFFDKKGLKSGLSLTYDYFDTNDKEKKRKEIENVLNEAMAYKIDSKGKNIFGYNDVPIDKSNLSSKAIDALKKNVTSDNPDYNYILTNVNNNSNENYFGSDRGVVKGLPEQIVPKTCIFWIICFGG